jgi:hypothetical protein
MAQLLPVVLRTAAEHLHDTDLAEFLRRRATAEASHHERITADLSELGVQPGDANRGVLRLLQRAEETAGSDQAFAALGLIDVSIRIRQAIKPDSLIPQDAGAARRYLTALAEHAHEHADEFDHHFESLSPDQRGCVTQFFDEIETLIAAALTDAVQLPSQSKSKDESAANATSSDTSSESAGLIFKVAANVHPVVAAWRLVYKTYLKTGLIRPNPHRIHTAPQAVSPGTVVIVGNIRSVVVTTLSAFVDTNASAGGLPLDRVYGPQLDALRLKGRTLMEVGLFADRRHNLTRTAETLFQLMRFAFHYGVESNVTDFVIGVNPRHARFYERSFGFQVFGPVHQYAAVNDNPVVLLRGDLEHELKQSSLHPALKFFVDHPVPSDTFEPRVQLSAAMLTGTPIAAFLRDCDPPSRLGLTA